jgi:multiple sugar transport system permease protein
MSWRKVRRWSGAGLMACISVVWLVPIAFTVLTAFKTTREFSMGSVLDFPQQFSIGGNISAAWQLGDLGQGFINSLLYATVGAICAVFFGSLAAYAIVHLRIRGGFTLFMLMFVGTLFPIQMLIVPLYRAYSAVGLYNTQLGMLILYTGIAIPFCLFVLRNYFTTIAPEVLEASVIDGCSRLRVYWSIVLPLARPALSILFLTQFVWIWNDLLFGLTLSQTSDVRPVMAGLASLTGTYGSGSVPDLMAAALVVSGPAIVLFFLFQRTFMQGMRLTTVGS